MKQIAIDAFLRWAWADEWPKAQVECDGPAGVGAAWDRVGAWRVGGVNSFGVHVDLGATKPVHPDASAMYEALSALDEAEVGLPDDWNPMADLRATPCDGASERDVAHALMSVRARALTGMSVVDRDGVRRLKGKPRALVLQCASLKRPPAWEGDDFEVRAVRRNGKPLWFVREQRLDSYGLPFETEVDGRDHRRNRPKVGAYRKWECDPDPTPALVHRAEYEIWWACMALLVDVLREIGLRDHDVRMVDAPVRPWEAPVRAKRRVLAA